jgi:hypothetical protein
VAAVQGNPEIYLGEPVEIVYSRIDANGALREAREVKPGTVLV